jgi:hypothetical protein
LFGADLQRATNYVSSKLGFRCVYVPTPNAGGAGGYAPQINALGRVSDLGNSIENSAVTIVGGGAWNLKWVVSDTESEAANITVAVRRKITDSATDFPTTSEAVYTSGTAATLTQLRQETAFASAAVPNNNTYVNYLVTATDQAGNSVSQTFSVQNTASCPSGYVGVPGNPINGLGNTSATIGNGNKQLDPSRAFCVMKYPAKNNNSSTIATSTATGNPWVTIQRGTDATTASSAMKACADNGSGFALISNTQWQVVARNAESVASNWSGSAVGTGVLNRGHSDNSPANALANSTNDTNGYFGTGNSPAAGAEQKRTHTLSNGVVVWDFAGNVWSWVSDNSTSLGMSPHFSTSAWGDYNNGTYFPSVNRLLFAPSGAFSATQNAGGIYGGTGAVLRGGGSWIYDNAGLFAATLNTGSLSTDGGIGFRCVYMP